MRRAAPAMPISPRLLKHFAAATLVITALLAMFADGAVTEEVVERVEKNKLAKADVNLVGARDKAQQGIRVKVNGPAVPIDSGDFIEPSAGSGDSDDFQLGAGDLMIGTRIVRTANPKPTRAVKPKPIRPPIAGARTDQSTASKTSAGQPVQVDVEALLNASQSRSGSRSD